MTQTTTPLRAYVPTKEPQLDGGDPRYVRRELSNIAASISNLVIVAPQAATKAPPVLIDGMIRLARSPWRPVSGQTADEWVYYDATTATWKAL